MDYYERSELGEFIDKMIADRRIPIDMFNLSIQEPKLSKIKRGAAPPDGFEMKLYQTLCVSDAPTQIKIADLCKKQRENPVVIEDKPIEVKPKERDREAIIETALLGQKFRYDINEDWLRDLSDEDFQEVSCYLGCKYGQSLGVVSETEMPAQPDILAGRKAQ